MNKTITVSAFSDDAGEFYRFYYGANNFEDVPKSEVKFLEASKTGEDFGEGIESRYFEVPIEIFKELKGVEFYSIL